MMTSKRKCLKVFPKKISRKRTTLLLMIEETSVSKGLIVIRYYLALRGAENGVTAMVTPFFCVQG